jgi:hypothetical protein
MTDDTKVSVRVQRFTLPEERRPGVHDSNWTTYETAVSEMKQTRLYDLLIESIASVIAGDTNRPKSSYTTWSAEYAKIQAVLRGWHESFLYEIYERRGCDEHVLAWDVFHDQIEKFKWEKS